MLALKIITVLLGLAFMLFGYFIFFRQKYFPVNGFEAELKAGRKAEKYAKCVGLVEWILGVTILLAGFALVLFG